MDFNPSWAYVALMVLPALIIWGPDIIAAWRGHKPD